MIKILIVDDHPIVRQGLRQVLRDTPEIVVAGEAGDGEAALCEIKEQDYDVVLLDISMPGRNGLEILSQIRLEKPELNVLVLSMYTEEQYAIRALKNGASGFITKASAPDELLNAIGKVAMGKKYVSTDLADKLAHILSQEPGPSGEMAASGGHEVMGLLAPNARRPSETGEEATFSSSTFAAPRSRFFERMCFGSNAAFTRQVAKRSVVH